MADIKEPLVQPPPPNYADIEGQPASAPPQPVGPYPQVPPAYVPPQVPPNYPPPQQNYPPPTYPQQGYTGYTPPVPQTQQNNVIVTQQPSTVVYTRQYGSSDHYLTLSIFMSFLCFFCGSWYALLCTIPAIFYALNAQEAQRNGNELLMLRYRRAALRLNISAITTYIFIIIIIIIYFPVRYTIYN